MSNDPNAGIVSLKKSPHRPLSVKPSIVVDAVICPNNFQKDRSTTPTVHLPTPTWNFPQPMEAANEPPHRSRTGGCVAMPTFPVLLIRQIGRIDRGHFRSQSPLFLAPGFPLAYPDRDLGNSVDVPSASQNISPVVILHLARPHFMISPYKCVHAPYACPLSPVRQPYIFPLITSCLELPVQCQPDLLLLLLLQLPPHGRRTTGGMLSPSTTTGTTRT